MDHVPPRGQAIVRPDFLGVSKPFFGDEEAAEILDCMRSGWVIGGPRVARLERELADHLGVADVLCLTSCTAGLTLALRLADVGAGDEVLVPAITFVACANVVEGLGAIPVLVDVDPATGLVDLDALQDAVTPRTRAIMPVHLAGRPVELDRVAQIANRHGLVVIEDAAHAIGGAWDGLPIGAHGNLCSFSFHATKNMTTIEGGALVVPDEHLAHRARRLAGQGLSRSAWERHGGDTAHAYDVIEPGYKFVMADVNAAVGLHQLPRLGDWIERRTALAERYDAALWGLPLMSLAPVDDRARHARHLQIVKLDDSVATQREEVVARLRSANVGSSVHFRGIHLHTYYRKRYGLAPETLPMATEWSRCALTLPLHPAMTEDDVDYVTDALAEALAGAER